MNNTAHHSRRKSAISISTLIDDDGKTTYVLGLYGREHKDIPLPTEGIDWHPSLVGIRCFQCGVRRLPTVDYFDKLSLITDTLATELIPNHAYTFAWKGVPICLLCQWSITSVMPIYNMRGDKHYIYQLCYPLGDKPFYVGVTKNIQLRYRNHCLNDDGSDKGNQVLGVLHGEGLPPTMRIVATCASREQAEELEDRTMLSLLAEGTPITNRRFKNAKLFGFNSNGEATKYASSLWRAHVMTSPKDVVIKKAVLP